MDHDLGGAEFFGQLGGRGGEDKNQGQNEKKKLRESFHF